MVTMRITYRWGGFTGAPGYSNFHFEQDFHTGAEWDDTNVAIRAMFQAAVGLFPTGLTITPPTSADLFNTETGELQSTVPLAAPAVVAGSGSSIFAGPAGAVLTWNTGTVAAGRRVRGRTFLVPLSTAAYQSDGSLLPATVTTLQSAAATLVNNTGGNPFVVWKRPVGGAGGLNAPVTSYTVPDLVAVLKSRRD